MTGLEWGCAAPAPAADLDVTAFCLAAGALASVSLLNRSLYNQPSSPPLSFALATPHKKVAASSSLFRHCNCCFTIECLNNSLQILCIYGKLLSSHL